MFIDDQPVSGTKLANNMDKAFTREQLIQFLKRHNLLDENGAPTERGIRNGISLRQSEWPGNNGTWLVYDKECQERIQKCIPHIQKEEVPKKERKRKKKVFDRSPENVVKTDLSFLNDIPFTGFRILPIGPEFVVLDTETTGLTRLDEVVELGIIDQDGNILYESLFSHEQPMDPEAYRVNKISENKLLGAPRISEESEKIFGILKGKTVIGHNISFDQNMLRQSFARYGVYFKGFEDKIDSRTLAKKILFSEQYSLQALSNLLGISGQETHRAVDDCLWTLKMLQNLEKLLELTSICRI